jgi:hypothetical protein
LGPDRVSVGGKITASPSEDSRRGMRAHLLLQTAPNEFRGLIRLPVNPVGGDIGGRFNQVLP